MFRLFRVTKTLILSQGSSKLFKFTENSTISPLKKINFFPKYTINSGTLVAIIVPRYPCTTLFPNKEINKFKNFAFFNLAQYHEQKYSQMSLLMPKKNTKKPVAHYSCSKALVCLPASKFHLHLSENNFGIISCVI